MTAARKLTAGYACGDRQLIPEGVVSVGVKVFFGAVYYCRVFGDFDPLSVVGDDGSAVYPDGVVLGRHVARYIGDRSRPDHRDARRLRAFLNRKRNFERRAVGVPGGNAEGFCRYLVLYPEFEGFCIRYRRHAVDGEVFVYNSSIAVFIGGSQGQRDGIARRDRAA